jgi:hypothetical protein
LSNRVQFASPEWIARIKEVLAALVDDHRETLRDADFTLAETFTKVPPDAISTHWAANIRGGEVSFVDNPERPDFALTADYEAARPGALLIYKDALAADLAAADLHRNAMVAAGRMAFSGGLEKAGKPMIRVLRMLHDTMARQTI